MVRQFEYSPHNSSDWICGSESGLVAVGDRTTQVRCLATPVASKSLDTRERH